jgi:hypothetical protein
VGSDGIKWKATASNLNVMYASGSEDIQVLRHFGTKPNTLLKIWAPTGPLTDNHEATVALVRGDNDEEFIDIYNNGYTSETQYGIRIQKRATGQWRDFFFDRASLKQIDPPPAPPTLVREPILVLRATDPTQDQVSAEFYGQWVRLPQVAGDPSTAGWGLPEKGRMWFNTNTNRIRYWDGSTPIKTVSFT